MAVLYGVICFHIRIINRVSYNDAFRLLFREPKWCRASKPFEPHNVTTFDAMVPKLVDSLWHSLSCCDNVIVRSSLCSDMFKHV